MKKEWFLDRYCGQQFAALVEDGQVVEFAAEKESDGEVVVGNIYKGRVTNVLAGMNAAFVSCGLKRNCYLSTDESYTDCAKYEGTAVPPTAPLGNLQVGDEIIVQVTKPPRGNKGAKVTTLLSFVGKRVIYLPDTDFIGVSRKIVDEEQRKNLLNTAEKLREKGAKEGFILRTQAPLAAFKELKKEAAYLKKLYLNMKEGIESAPVGTVLYQDDDLPVRAMRDSIGEEVVAMHVGDEELYKRLRKLARLRGDIPEKKIVRYTGERAMMKEYGISQLVYDATKPTVPLANGGSLVIDYTEAMTVIDVNSGSHIGDTNLEETVFAVNLDATKEIARQVRLRNIGGIVVVDFIDMTDETHKERVTQALTELLEKDKAKCHVLPMSELCITQFTRKRLGNELASHLVKPCSHCHGNGSVHDDLFMMTKLREDLLDCFADGYRSAIVELNDGMMRKILQEGTFSKEMQGRWHGKQIYLIPHKTYREHYFHVRGETDSVLTLPNNAQLLY